MEQHIVLGGAREDRLTRQGYRRYKRAVKHICYQRLFNREHTIDHHVSCSSHGVTTGATASPSLSPQLCPLISGYATHPASHYSELLSHIRGNSNRSFLNSFLHFCVHGAWLLFRQNYAAHCVSLEGLLSLFQTDKSFESMIMRWFIPMAKV